MGGSIEGVVGEPTRYAQIPYMVYICTYAIMVPYGCTYQRNPLLMRPMLQDVAGVASIQAHVGTETCRSFLSTSVHHADAFKHEELLEVLRCRVSETCTSYIADLDLGAFEVVQTQQNLSNSR